MEEVIESEGPDAWTWREGGEAGCLGYRKTGDEYVLYREIGQSFDQQRNPTQIDPCVRTTPPGGAHPVQGPDMVRTIRVSPVEQVLLRMLMKFSTSTAGNPKQEIDRRNGSFTNRKIGRTRGRIRSVGPAPSALDDTCIALLTD